MQFSRHDGSFSLEEVADGADRLEIARAELLGFLRSNGIYDLTIIPVMHSENLVELTML